jgi:glycosyltransferase involved in cell wall biosynthesis
MASNYFTPEEKQLLDRSVDFMDKCEKGIIISKEKFTLSENPKISVIIPVYAASATIKKAIRSIQNQKFQDLEIILFDDNSPDNSYDVMKEIQKEDPRIHLYRNEVNRGVFYNRLTASLIAKGKYVMYLDNDDMFSRDDIFNIVYDEIEKTNYDIIEFNGYSTHDFHLINKDKNIKSTSKLKEEIVIKQPELSKLFLKRINDDEVVFGDTYLWGKIIRTDLMKKCIEIIGKERYEQKVLYHDDECTIDILLQNAQSFKFINVYGIFYYTNQESITHSKRPFQTCFDILFFINFLYEFSTDEQKEKIGIRLMNEWDCKVTDGLDEKNTSFAKEVIKKLMDCELINSNIKQKIKEKCLLS